MKKQCQSCGMAMKQGQADLRGSNADGSRNEIYCNQCYLNGKFTDPHITADIMIEKNMKLIESSNMNKFKKWILKKSYPSMIKRLDRWK